MGTGRGSWEGVEPPSRRCPVPHPQDEREAGEGAQGRLCCRRPRAPLPALHVCAGRRHCWCVPAQGARGEAPASGRGASAAPEVPSAPLCLQTVPRLLGPRPPRSSPRRSPPSQRLRRPPCPAATAGWAGPSTAAGCESLPCPVSPTRHGRHLAAAQGRGALGPLLSLLLPQGGGRPPRLCDGAAVLWLPCEYEGLGEWKPLPRVRGRWALAWVCACAAPAPTSALCCSPPWISCHPTYWPRPSSAARGTACSAGVGGVARGGPSGSRFPACGFPRAEAEQEIQERLLEAEDGARPGATSAEQAHEDGARPGATSAEQEGADGL